MGSAFDLTGWSTLLLAIVTTILAAVTARQVHLTRVATDEGFKFEAVRQFPSTAPILTAEASAKRSSEKRLLALRNVGAGPAINIRFSGVVSGAMFTAGQCAVNAIGPSQKVETGVALSNRAEARDPITELVIRYEDLFGNTYSTEYQRFDEDAEWYVWRQPWIGKDIGMARPRYCSDDAPTWGFNSRMYYDSQNQLY